MAVQTSTLQDELLYVIQKLSDEIADLKSRGLPADNLEHRLDQHYARLRSIDGAEPDL